MLLHRHHITTLLQTLLVLFAFASCIDDEYVDYTSGSLGNKEYYLYLRFESAYDWSQTRAGAVKDSTNVDDDKVAGNGDFVHGNKETEQKIDLSSSFIIFFDDKGNLFKNPIQDLADGGWDKENEGDYLTDEGREEEEDIKYLEAGYKTRIYPARDDDGNLITDADGKPIWPSECLLVLNGPDKDKLKSKIEEGELNTKDDILKFVWDWDKEAPKSIGRTEDGYFTMTNSIYVSEDGKTKYTTAKIEEKHIKAVSEKEDLDPEDMLRIRVERMVAKFSLNVEEGKDNQNKDNKLIFEPVYPKNNPLTFFDGISDDGMEFLSVIDWQIKITGWGINALESQNHIFKNIKALKNRKVDDGYFDYWSDPRYYRSYWSEDPHYDEDENQPYPWQYRDAVDRTVFTNFHYYSKDQFFSSSAPGSSPLKNYSYNDFVNLTYPEDPENGGERKDNFDRVIYTPENTYGDLKQNLDTRINLLAGTHLIICAEMLLHDKDGNFVPTDFYRDRSGICYRSLADCYKSFVHAFNNTLTSQESMEFAYYNWDTPYDKDNGKVFIAKTTKKETGKNFQLYYKGTFLTDDNSSTLLTSMAPATVVYGDGKRLPWPEKGDGELTILTEGTEGLMHLEIVDEAGNMVTDKEYHNIVKSLLYEWLGALDHFSDGKMYYSAPVLHNGAGKSEKERNKYELGDYGVVRNNWYKFNLSTITGMGTSVDNPGDPIVPNRVDINDVINVKISILDWCLQGTDAPILQW